jgi:archaellum biogenesis ATPase FlaH
MADLNKSYDTNVDTLAKFGPSFQSKVAAVMMQSPEFLEQSFDIINPNFFELDANKWIVKNTLTYFSEYKTLPTLEVFKVELNQQIKDDTFRTAIVEQLRGIFQRIKDTDLDYVRDSFIEFAKNQTLKSAIIKSVDLLQNGQYGDIKTLIDGAMRSGQPKTVGHDWKKDVELRLTKSARNTVATGWDIVDTHIGGGLAGGELGVIAAPSGIGKSWALSTIGANALRAGKRVVHYTLELNENYVGLRYDTIYTGIEPGKIPDNADVVRSLVETIKGEIIIKYYPAKTVTCHSLLAHIQQMTSLGFKPDVIIVDYADLLSSVHRTDARYQELGAIYEELRGIAGELNIPIWTASQTQRSSIQDDIIQADKIAESYSKIMTADLVISISRKLEDKMSKTGRAHIIKNRFGPDGQTFPMIIDTGIGKIEIFDEKSAKGIALKQQMQAGEGITKQNLAKKLLEMDLD